MLPAVIAHVQAKNKLTYILRREQQQAVDATYAYYQKCLQSGEREKAEFLWNAKPRFGKTLTSYDFMRKMDARMVLIVTNRPAIANSWFDDFEKFIALANRLPFCQHHRFPQRKSNAHTRAIFGRTT